MKHREVAVAFSAKPDTDLQMILAVNADRIHVDIIDKSFAGNVAVDTGILERLNKMTSLPLDIHIMAKKPSEYINMAGYADTFLFHYEIDEDIEEILSRIPSGIKKGIVINPETSIEKILPYLQKIDAVLVLGVNPGFSGQKMVPETIEKAKMLYEMKRSFILIFDGGVTTENAKIIPADVIVSGSTILNSENPKKTIELLR